MRLAICRNGFLRLIRSARYCNLRIFRISCRQDYQFICIFGLDTKLSCILQTVIAFKIPLVPASGTGKLCAASIYALSGLIRVRICRNYGTAETPQRNLHNAYVNIGKGYASAPAIFGRRLLRIVRNCAIGYGRQGVSRHITLGADIKIDGRASIWQV